MRPITKPDDIRRTPVTYPLWRNKPNWVQSLLHKRMFMTPNASELTAQRYRDSNTSGQLPQGDSGDTYATKIQAQFAGGLRSGDVLPIVGNPLAIHQPWPTGRPTGRPTSPRGRDVPKVGPEAMAPVILPLRSTYKAFFSRSDTHRADFVRGLGALEFGPAPNRIPFTRKAGISLMAGIHQFSTQQHFGGMQRNLVTGPPRWSDNTRGTRSVSGILGRVQGPGHSHVPATFVPREVR